MIWRICKGVWDIFDRADGRNELRSGDDSFQVCSYNV